MCDVCCLFWIILQFAYNVRKKKYLIVKTVYTWCNWALRGLCLCRIVRNKAAEKAKQSMPPQHNHHHHHHHHHGQPQQQSSQTPCSLSPSPTAALISSASTPAAGYTIGSILGIPIPSLAALPLPPTGAAALSPPGTGTERLPACSGTAASSKRIRDDTTGKTRRWETL